ncbi:hypothetical protein NPIL_164831 [Nephila pilipes]|uniref:Uncharacterized protein n=1 Tax=Nephila pilipes TaxID=299642 RepID=A0A8X6UB02_NEPPI|nr:hypothetical protein NPIL_164831 [Nephila pilipes]
MFPISSHSYTYNQRNLKMVIYKYRPKGAWSFFAGYLERIWKPEIIRFGPSGLGSLRNPNDSPADKLSQKGLGINGPTQSLKFPNIVPSAYRPCTGQRKRRVDIFSISYV